MRNFNAALQAEADGRGRLAFATKVTRRDTTAFGWIMHDQPKTFDDGFGSLTYKASQGARRTVMSARDDNSVDNWDLTAFLNSGDLDEDDIRAGRWDFADVRLYLLSWFDPQNTFHLFDKGAFGHISMEDGRVTAEFRGLAQLLQATKVDVYTAECPHDLFDAACGLLEADYKHTGTITTVAGQATFDASLVFAGDAGTRTLTINIPVDNPGFEDGDLTGWTTDAGLWKVISKKPRPRTGKYQATQKGSQSESIISQTKLLADSGIADATIDAGGLSASVEGWHQSKDKRDPGQIVIEALDAADGVLATGSSPLIVSKDVWVKGAASVALPALTRKVRVKCRATITGGSRPDVGFDDIGNLAVTGDGLAGGAGYFEGGRIDWITGNNAGLSEEIKSYNPGTDEIVLFLPMYFEIQAGDTFEAFPGCDKSLATCRDRFDNAVVQGGFLNPGDKFLRKRGRPPEE